MAASIGNIGTAGEIAVTLAALTGYVITALGFSTIYRATVLFSLWQLGMESLHLSGLSALEKVTATGQPSSAIGEGLSNETEVRVPGRTRRRKKKQGVKIEAPERERGVPICDDENGEIDAEFSYDPRGMQDLRETLDACCENDTDREIIRLREAGYVDREIADILAKPPITIYVMRRAIYARFLELTGWKGEA